MSDYETEPVRTAVAPLKFRVEVPGEWDSRRFDLEKLFLEESALCHAFNERDLVSPLENKTTEELTRLARDFRFFSSRSAIPSNYWDEEVTSGNLYLRHFEWDGNDASHIREVYQEFITEYRQEFLAFKSTLKDTWIDPDLLTPGIYESKVNLPPINDLFRPSTTVPRNWRWQKDTLIPGGILAEVAQATEAHICTPLDIQVYRERFAAQLEAHVYHPNKAFMDYYQD